MRRGSFMSWCYYGRLPRRYFIATLYRCMRDKDDSTTLWSEMDGFWHSRVAGIVLEVPVIPVFCFSTRLGCSQG